MSRADDSPIADGPVIQRVVLVDRIERPAARQSEFPSLPGHLIHLTASGRARQESEGRAYELEPGIAVWFHDDELVRTQTLGRPWVFYTVNFIAPALTPPPFDQRVKRIGSTATRCFKRLLESWRDRDTSVMPAVRHMRVHARLLDLLAELLTRGGSSFRIDSATQLWWDLEAQIRPDLSRPIDMRSIQKLTTRSLRTVIRSCQCAVGMPPMQRVKHMRLSMARGLVLYSELAFSEIGRRVGCRRVQQFSRDYHNQFGLTPTEDRTAGPDHQLDRPRPQRSN